MIRMLHERGWVIFATIWCEFMGTPNWVIYMVIMKTMILLWMWRMSMVRSEDPSEFPTILYNINACVIITVALSWVYSLHFDLSFMLCMRVSA